MVNNNREYKEVLGYRERKFDHDRDLAVNEFDMMSEDFYLSGYEAILIPQVQYISKKTVIASTISFDNEVLLLKGASNNYEVKEICTDLGVSYLELDCCCNDACLVNVELVLNAHKDISHVYVEFNESNLPIINELNRICNDAKVNLIANIESYDHSLIGRCITNQVPFVIMPNDQESVVIASRRNLVQTEGVSSSFTYDLYTLWQNSLNKRKPCITPMTA
ncbi:hypothetical protein [Plebeiibacterium sediminum]|uniref:Uncharacterized protein n=1 Tax=Plebeiibacterium sediminum TaxID=2992112 RepID=A0AAE3SHB4_9BACT|nr:hypothetical protein [Plebeiobacterium sediminum]MCW3788058.1 hypothetical protein [Plebeiobacterium sediminum]